MNVEEISYSAKCYTLDNYSEYFIEIVRFKGIIEVWISHTDYGIKKLIIGIQDYGEDDDIVFDIIDIDDEVNQYAQYINMTERG